VLAGCVGGEREAATSQGGEGAMRRWSPLVAGGGFAREVAVAGLILDRRRSGGYGRSACQCLAVKDLAFLNRWMGIKWMMFVDLTPSLSFI
jgi:hypothetical protein